jgi:MFS transporter, DHA1 family, tetracycline resistance protein
LFVSEPTLARAPRVRYGADGVTLPASAAEPAVASAPTRAAFAFVFVTVLLDMLALGVMAPVLPKLIIDFQGGDIAGAATMVGVFGFAWAAMQFVFSPVLGTLSDRFGRRPVILISNFGLGLDYLLMAVAPSLSWLFVGRLISGMTAASFATAGAYIADVTPPEKRAARFGMLGAAFGLGFIIGPAVGGVLGGIDLRLPFWAAAGLSLVNAGYGLFVLPESLSRERRSKLTWAKANPLGSLRLLRGQPALLGLAVSAFLYYGAHESLPSIFVLYTDYRYGWDESAVGFALAAIGIAMTIVQAGLVGPLVRRLGERRALLAGIAFGIAGFAIYGAAPTGLVFSLSIPVLAMWGLIGPAMQALMSRRVGPNEQGQLQGALSSLRGITGMIGPLVFTQVFAASIARGGGALAGAAYFLAAILLVLSLGLAWRVTRD